MSLADTLLPEFDQEMATTRKLLERVPADKGQWKPHPKSFPLGHLAQLVARMPSWLLPILNDTKLDLSTGVPYSFEPTDVLLATFDQGVHDAREAIAASDAVDLTAPWSLTHGERVIFTVPRGAIVRSTINHLIHHRGQLSVYLRLVDVPLPSIYGPTADEPW
jgi:uncharacterized damage-inducible protein DinB